MKKISFFIILMFIIISFSCQSEGVNAPPPQKVQMVVKSIEADTLERGVDAIPEEDAIFIEWRANTDEYLAGYEIFRSQSPDKNFIKIATIKKKFSLIDTFYIDDTPSLNERYYYYIRAIDDFDQQSDPGDVVDYKLLHKPILNFPRGPIQTTMPIIIWDFSSEGIPPDNFIFRMQVRRGQKFINYHTQLLAIGVDYAPHQEWTISELLLSNPIPQGEYRWRIDPVGSETNHGSESIWQNFTVQ